MAIEGSNWVTTFNGKFIQLNSTEKPLHYMLHMLQLEDSNWRLKQLQLKGLIHKSKQLKGSTTGNLRNHPFDALDLKWSLCMADKWFLCVRRRHTWEHSRTDCADQCCCPGGIHFLVIRSFPVTDALVWSRRWSSRSLSGSVTSGLAVFGRGGGEGQ